MEFQTFDVSICNGNKNTLLEHQLLHGFCVQDLSCFFFFFFSLLFLTVEDQNTNCKSLLTFFHKLGKLKII